jgi:hypothetical protein
LISSLNEEGKMEKRECDLSKRDFLKKSFALSAGLMCMPGISVFPENRKMNHGIYRRIAMFQEETARGIMCRICPNECVLKEGELSKCNNRRVHNSNYSQWHLVIHVLLMLIRLKKNHFIIFSRDQKHFQLQQPDVILYV